MGDCVVAEDGNVGKADDQLLGAGTVAAAATTGAAEVAPLLIEVKPEVLVGPE